MTDTPASTAAAFDAMPRLDCPVCGAQVPAAPFCGACGTHLLRHDGALDRGRMHAYAAAPGEHVLRLSFVSSLFPQLPHRSRAPFRAGFAALVLALVALSWLRLEAPLIAVAAFGVPALFLLYLNEVEVYEREDFLRTAAALVLGAGLGAGWALVVRHTTEQALEPQFIGGAFSSSQRILTAFAVPAVGQLLMVVPVIALRFSGRRRLESLDGFIFGAAGALGLTIGATLAQLAPVLSDGIRADGTTQSVMTQGLLHGVAVPLLAAATSGLFGAALWVRRSSRSVHRGGWLTSPWLALATAVAVQIGLGITDVVQPGDPTLLVAHLAAAALFVVALRIGLHYVLLHEEQDVRVGPPRVCPHCHHIVPEMPFCPHCGVAERASSRTARAAQLLTPEGGPA